MLMLLNNDCLRTKTLKLLLPQTVGLTNIFCILIHINYLFEEYILDEIFKHNMIQRGERKILKESLRIYLSCLESRQQLM